MNVAGYFVQIETEKEEAMGRNGPTSAIFAVLNLSGSQNFSVSLLNIL